jgi:hypothetical protein
MQNHQSRGTESTHSRFSHHHSIFWLGNGSYIFASSQKKCKAAIWCPSGCETLIAFILLFYENGTHATVVHPIRIPRHIHKFRHTFPRIPASVNVGFDLLAQSLLMLPVSRRIALAQQLPFLFHSLQIVRRLLPQRRLMLSFFCFLFC